MIGVAAECLRARRSMLLRPAQRGMLLRRAQRGSLLRRAQRDLLLRRAQRDWLKPKELGAKATKVRSTMR